MRTIDWVDGEIHLIDQTRLPDELVVLRITELDQLIDAIARLAVRGAPALGVAGGFGRRAPGRRPPGRRGAPCAPAPPRLRAARPTAVNLAWGVDRALACLPDGPDAVLAEALRIRDEDIAACAAMATRGADLIARARRAADACAR